MLPVLFALAQAQPVSQVPPGASAVTVMLCPRGDGCAAEWRALVAHVGPLSLPLLDFDVVAAAGPGGRDALLAYEAEMAPLRDGKQDANAVSRLLDRLQGMPFTVTNEDLFLLWMSEGVARFPSIESDRALARAASVSSGRVTNLGALPPQVTARYLDIVTTNAGHVGTVRVSADVPGRVFIDGRAVGDAPVEVTVPIGWHRISVERAGRLTAWTGAAEVMEGESLAVRATIAADDGPAALEAAVVAARRGATPPQDVVEELRAWGRANGLTWVRFVELRPAGGPGTPEEIIPDPDPAKGSWEVLAAYLDVPAGRLGIRGPGPAAMAVAGDPDRFRLGVSLGYARLQEFEDTDSVPAHDHATAEIAAQLRLLPPLALDLRLGLFHSAQPYYLDEDWLDDNVYPVSLGARLGNARGGPYAALGAVVVVPYAVGGQLVAGWDLAPASSWRIAPEVRGAVVDKGWMLGGTVVVTRLR